MKTWTRFKEQCATVNIKGNFTSLLFNRKKLVELNEWLHEAYLNNNEDIHKLKVQNEQLLEMLQDTCSSSYVSDCHMGDFLEDSHDIMDHEKHGKFQVLIDVFEYDLDESQSLVVVEEELELPLDNGYTLLEEVHDSITLEPIYEGSFILLSDMHNPTLMDP